MMRQTVLHSLLLSILLAMMSLQGCAPVIVAGTATGISLASERRSAGAIVDDQNIELQAVNSLRGNDALTQRAHIVVTSYNGVVLLTGQAESTALQRQAVELVRDIPLVKRLHNEIRISAATTLKTRSHDTWLTTQIKSQLLRDEQLNGLQIKVVTENSQTFLMGLVTHKEAERAVSLARKIDGVESVIKVFEYLD